MDRKNRVRVSPRVWLMVLFLGGFLLGAVVAIKKEALFPHKNIFTMEYFSELRNITMDSGVVLLLALWKRLRSFFLFLLLSSSVIGIWYLAFFILSFGFSVGITLEILILNFGITGAGIYLLIILPQGIFYFLGYSILWIREIKRKRRNGEYFMIQEERKKEKRQLLIALFLLIFGSISEAYLNFFSLLFIE